MESGDGWILLGLLFVVGFVAFTGSKILTAAVTVRALAMTPLLSRIVSKWFKSRNFSDEEFFHADGAGEPWRDRRKHALDRLADLLQTRCAKSIAWGDTGRREFLRFAFYRCQSSALSLYATDAREVKSLSVVTASQGPKLRDLDGHWTLDVSGSYGLNVTGFDRYKEWMDKGWERVKDLGPVLGPLHPVVAENIALLKSVAKMDEVSFHMSGTEAVMAAVRLARFNTRRKLIVCFSGAYHGWWDGVQPGLGSERELTIVSH